MKIVINDVAGQEHVYGVSADSCSLDSVCVYLQSYTRGAKEKSLRGTALIIDKKLFISETKKLLKELGGGE